MPLMLMGGTRKSAFVRGALNRIDSEQFSHSHVRNATVTVWRFIQRGFFIWGVILMALVFLTTLI